MHILRSEKCLAIQFQMYSSMPESRIWPTIASFWYCDYTFYVWLSKAIHLEAKTLPVATSPLWSSGRGLCDWPNRCVTYSLASGAGGAVTVWEGSGGRHSAASCIPQALPSVEGTSADLLFQLMCGAEGIPSAVCRVLNPPYSDQTLTQSFDI